MSTIISIFTLIIIAFYSLMMIAFAIAFITNKVSENIQNSSEFVSVIIACRNEEANISHLIESLLQQKYTQNFEIIIVNDHSEDKTLEIIRHYNDSRIKLLELPDNMLGKKSALRFGVLNSIGTVLLFTDADCIVPINWIKNMTKAMLTSNAEMLCGPVVFKENKSIFNKLFRLEFMSLTGSGAAGFFIKHPFMCNGANYAIYKSCYLKSVDKINDKYSSGDDVFLLHEISKNKSAYFVKNKNTTVITNAPENLKAFFSQRIRWASKTTGYTHTFAITVAILTFITSIILITLPLAAMFYSELWFLLLLIFISKTIVDITFLLPVSKFYDEPKLTFLVPLLQVFYPFYIVITAVFSLFYKPNWKGRRIKR
jgi:cellulose synthase/poly-beta-1,6-N-acetylglucosamine synthase-like glycosyltransferase